MWLGLIRPRGRSRSSGGLSRGCGIMMQMGPLMKSVQCPDGI
ncbi:hypothetical protein OROMI_029905 [Orobanche minor]